MRKIYKVLIALVVLVIASMMVVDIAHAESYTDEAYPEEPIYVARETIAEYNDYLGLLTVSRFTRLSDGGFDYRMYYYTDLGTFHFYMPEDLEKVMTLFDKYRTKLADGQRRDVRDWTLSRLRNKAMYFNNTGFGDEYFIDERATDTATTK